MINKAFFLFIQLLIRIENSFSQILCVITIPLLFIALFIPISCNDFFNNTYWIYFLIAYFLHLFIDWLDIDIKYYLYPFKIEFKGFLPIWSKTEQLFTVILVIATSVLLLI